jgi:thiamine-phosphate pyrophosphorylase
VNRPPENDLRHALRLLVLTDPERSRGRTHREIASLALRGGATAVQLRDKEAQDADLLAWARQIRALTRRSDALFLVNDRLDVARLAEADGCHLGPEDLSLADARRLWPRPAVIGYSAGTPQDARQAEAAGADYLGVGPVYATGTKADAGAPIGMTGLEAVAVATSLPIVAIGGIDARRAGECIAAGACGVAVISGVAGAASVAPAARALRRAVDRALSKWGTR